LSDPEQQPSTQVTDKVVASFNDYDGMIHALRGRAQERRIAITSPHVAEVSGLPNYYIAKLLSVHPVRRVGMISLGPLLAVLGVRLLMVEDPKAMAQYTDKFAKRVEHCAHDGAAIRFSFSRRFMRKIGLKGAQVRWAKVRKMHTAVRIAGVNSRKNMTAAAASAIARKAAKVRWAKAKAA